MKISEQLTKLLDARDSLLNNTLDEEEQSFIITHIDTDSTSVSLVLDLIEVEIIKIKEILDVRSKTGIKRLH